jgi:hypothetical protein
MANLGYHLARFYGHTQRRFYRALLPIIVRKQTSVPRTVALEVFAYSGEAMVPEQVASIRSFLRHVGRPRSFTVVSDGSHSARSIRWLRRIDPVVSVRLSVPLPSSGLPQKFVHYLSAHPTGKQLALIMSLPINGPALYIDSDVLFFAGASDLALRSAAHDAPVYYLADCQFSGDARLLRNPAEEKRPVNSGVLLFFKKLDWSLSIQRFLELEGDPNFFTNQTMTHLTLHTNGGHPLDPTKYVLQLDDQFVYRDHYAGAALALRHYVNPVRHKFWTSLRQ